MNRVLAVTVLTLCLQLCLPLAARAQQLPTFDAPMPTASQALQMRYSGLVAWAEKHSKSTNEVARDNLAAWYAKIRNQANQPQLQARLTLVAAMRAVGKWNSAYYSALLAYNRGGTMYVHAANRSAAELADVTADALAAWRKKPAKALAMNAIKSFSANYKTVPDYIDDHAEYARVLKDESRALDRAKESVNVLPPGPRNVVAKYMLDLSSTNWGEAK